MAKKKTPKQPFFTEGMTNAEKYKEVFGFESDMKSCPTYKCFE